jgi:hypothetical protein
MVSTGNINRNEKDCTLIVTTWRTSLPD